MHVELVNDGPRDDRSGRLTGCYPVPTPHFPTWRNGRAAPIFRERGREEDMTVYEKERQLHRDVAATVEGRLPDVEVLAVELGGPDRVCVYIDHPSGVDHALCERVTGVLRHYLDHYTLDVSSPGLDRPLRTREHFSDVIGRRVGLKTTHELAGRRRFRGDVLAASELAVTLESGGGQIEVPYEAIARGNLIDEG
jgi:ribosome maturation factor RimP